MEYKKPSLLGYAAIEAIKSLRKDGVNFEPNAIGKSIPAYEADE